MFEKARLLEKQGRRIIHLEIGEPDFLPPASVVEALCSSAKAGRVRYSDAPGLPELRRALASYLNAKYRTELSEEQVLITPGGRFSLYLSFVAGIRKEGTVALFAPDWPAYRGCVRFTGGEYVTLNTQLEDGWAPTVEEVDQFLGPGVGTVVLNSPSNPTGTILSRELIHRVAQIAVERHVTVVSDEVYADYSYRPHHSILQEPGCPFFLVGSFSKSWAMTGFRIGYAVSDPASIRRMAKVQSLLLTNVPEFVQLAALKALECREELEANVQLMRSRVDRVQQFLAKAPLAFAPVEGGLYLFPRLDKPGVDSASFALRLLEEKGVAVAPGSGFGPYPEFLRITLSQRDDLLFEGLSKIRELLEAV